MASTNQISFRIDEKTHLKAKELLTSKGGVSKYLKEEAKKFVTHEISLNPHVTKASTQSKRVSIKIDDELYSALQKRAVPFDGVSGIFRSILLRLIDKEALTLKDIEN